MNEYGDSLKQDTINTDTQSIKSPIKNKNLVVGKESIKSISWEATLYFNLIRSLIAGLIWTIIILILSQVSGQYTINETFSLLIWFPVIILLLLPFGFLSLYLEQKGLYFIKWLVSIISILIAIADPFIFIMKKINYKFVILDNPKILSLELIIAIYKTKEDVEVETKDLMITFIPVGILLVITGIIGVLIFFKTNISQYQQVNKPILGVSTLNNNKVQNRSKNLRKLTNLSITASSTMRREPHGHFSPNNLLDDNPATCWQENVSGVGIGEWIKITFPTEENVILIEIRNGYAPLQGGNNIYLINSRVKSANIIFSNGVSKQINLKDTPDLQTFKVSSNGKCSWLNFIITDVYYGTQWQDTCISDINIYSDKTQLPQPVASKLSDDPKYIVIKQYNSINSKDFSTAFYCWCDRKRSTIENFKRGYESTEYVKLKNIETSWVSDDNAKVRFILEFKDYGETPKTVYRAYIMIKEGGEWKICGKTTY